MDEVTKNKIIQHIFVVFFVDKDFLEKKFIQQMIVLLRG